MQVIQKYDLAVSRISHLLEEELGTVLKRIEEKLFHQRPGEVALLRTGAKLVLVADKNNWRVALHSYSQGRKDVPSDWKGFVVGTS